ncbi:MAG: hypothetical protein MUF87_16050 [Anaerolineae bacterium]|jgi:hypothetical protein|nr:hypothetical protein [Anaerolineae bacterium]
MNLAFSQVEYGIYLVFCQGSPKADELHLFFRELRDFIAAQDEPSHVLIVDAKGLKQLPIGPLQLSRMTLPNCVATLAINSPLIVKLIADIVTRLSDHPILFFNSLEEAIEKARELL